ncbi:MAG: GntR family transcriptional regulator [Novosphingobium sp.]
MSSIAYQRVKAKLLCGEYMPGQFLQVEEVSRDLELGRTPVHQALHLLGQEGMVEIIPRKGILVRADSMEDIRQAFEVRMLLEPHCAARCAEFATPELISALRESIEKQKALGNEPHSDELMPYDREMHSLITHNAHNKVIVDILQPIHERMTRTWLMPHWRERDFLTTIAEHEALVECIERGDADGAAAAMRAHLASVKGRMGLR